jgi:hypothetical protein
MREVLKSYAPFFIWLVLAAYSLVPAGASAAGDPVEAKLRLARTLLERKEWSEAARLQLPVPASAAWSGRPEAECELVFIRGLAAARAGYAGMARHSIERLEVLRERHLAAGQAGLANAAAARSARIGELLGGASRVDQTSPPR